MNVKIKKLSEDAKLPTYGKNGDAGMDLTAITKKSTMGYIEYGTGLAIEIPEGYVGLVYPRSSISKYDLALANSVGIIDSGYRGEIMLRFKRIESFYKQKDIYMLGDKVAQLIIIPYPKIVLEVMQELSQTERNEGGFGSTGN